MSERLRPPAGVLPTPDMESMRLQLHRLNVLASYRDLEPRGDWTAIELFFAGVKPWPGSLVLSGEPLMVNRG
jgi:hypothetical protein